MSESLARVFRNTMELIAERDPAIALFLYGYDYKVSRNLGHGEITRLDKENKLVYLPYTIVNNSTATLIHYDMTTVDSIRADWIIKQVRKECKNDKSNPT